MACKEQTALLAHSPLTGGLTCLARPGGLLWPAHRSNPPGRREVPAHHPHTKSAPNLSLSHHAVRLNDAFPDNAPFTRIAGWDKNALTFQNNVTKIGDLRPHNRPSSYGMAACSHPYALTPRTCSRGVRKGDGGFPLPILSEQRRPVILVIENGNE
eukprot:scaffold7226_cov27-Tisochrysis_lutea.AAC.1